VSELDESFALLLGRQPSDQERQRLYRVRDALKLKSNDAVWLLLMVLEHYETLYCRHPARLVTAVKEITKDVRETALAQARAAAAETTKALAHAVAAAATASAKKAAGAQMLKWAMGCFLAALGCIATIGWWAHGKGQREGYAVGYEAARDKYENAAALASWANTPEGQLAYGLAKAGSLHDLATCSGHGWFERDGVCYPSSKTHGWRLPAGTADQRRPGG
jgi:uncharacterized protein DUF6753